MQTESYNYQPAPAETSSNVDDMVFQFFVAAYPDAARQLYSRINQSIEIANGAPKYTSKVNGLFANPELRRLITEMNLQNEKPSPVMLHRLWLGLRKALTASTSQ